MTMTNQSVDDLAEQAQLLAADTGPLLERTGDEISGRAVRARDLIDELLQAAPITKPTTYAESLRAREDLRRAKSFGEMRDRLTAQIDRFVADTDAMAAGKDVDTDMELKDDDSIFSAIER
jgi:hypothetical protein